MSNISNATPQQLAELSAFVVQERAIVAQFAQSMAQMNQLNNNWNATIAAIIGTPAGLTVTDTSGLAGIVPLTDTNVYAILGYFQAILTAYYDAAHQQIFVQACGPTNMI
ncbi:MAG: hypothetical protein WCD69_00005 [Xanthobacteraceae bacterium]